MVHGRGLYFLHERKIRFLLHKFTVELNHNYFEIYVNGWVKKSLDILRSMQNML